jgi:hypothetical protein
MESVCLLVVVCIIFMWLPTVIIMHLSFNLTNMLPC